MLGHCYLGLVTHDQVQMISVVCDKADHIIVVSIQVNMLKLLV